MCVLDNNIDICRYFEDISKIPHGSYHEEKIADYVIEVVSCLNLNYIRDEMHNIIVFKDASEGYEKHPTIMLQGHLDMVNEKNNDCNHDFDKDALDLYVEDGLLYANNTTLGADDGVAVAYMLAILANDQLKHPALECVFTVQEEVGLFGASGLDTSNLRASRMIGLDSGSEGKTCVSSSGGVDVLIRKPISVINQNSTVYTITIKGLIGGHSGGCIHLGRGNANKIAGRILMYLLQNGIDVRLVDIVGGLKNNAIARECVIRFASESLKEDIEYNICVIVEAISNELKDSEPDFVVKLSEDYSDYSMTSQCSEEIINILYLCPNGMIERSQVINDLTTVSLNMGIIMTTSNELIVNYSIRSPIKSARDELINQIRVITSLFNGCIQVNGEYPGWDYDKSSKLRHLFKEFYQKHTGHSLVEVASHGGLETGIFKGKMPDLDIITMGPNMYDIHTPKECLDISSFIRTYKLLVDFLEIL